LRQILMRPPFTSMRAASFTAILIAVLLCLSDPSAAQQDDSAQRKLTVRSNLVLVPSFVTDRQGQVIFGLSAEDFRLTDNGIEQSLSLEPDTDSEPLALAVVAETGGLGANHLNEYGELSSILDALLSGVDHHIAVIAFDSTPHLILPFTSSTDDASRQLALLTSGDPGGNILDAVVFAVDQLRSQPPGYRRAILLLSETIDQGSATSFDDALRLVSNTNTAIYSFGFSSTHAAISREAGKFSSSKPGPAHGCFSRAGADPEYEGHYSKQVLDCISQLAPPLRLATMAFLTARNSLRVNTAQSIAELAGGQFFPFHNVKDLKTGLIALSNNIPNYYVLSFTPVSPSPGLHALNVSTRFRTGLKVNSRGEYWIDDLVSQPPSESIHKPSQ
jgi:VWFA-related protein